jgi:ribonuclease-3
MFTICRRMNSSFADIEQRLGYTFKKKKLLQTALTHKTFAFEASKPIEYNERLEFLGDSILNFVVAEQLYLTNKYFFEGELTRRRSLGVNNRFLARIAKDIGLGEFILLGKGEVKQNGSENPKTLANCLEAIIGAIYLDAGLLIAHKFILDKLYAEEFEF